MSETATHFLPTAQVVTRMRQECWAPVEVRKSCVRLEAHIEAKGRALRNGHVGDAAQVNLRGYKD